MELLTTTTLRDGRSMELMLACDGEPEPTDELIALIGHKGEPWMWHVKETLAGNTPGLRTLYYLARVEGRLTGNVTVFQNGPLGNISHVFTSPSVRQQGIARTLLGRAVSDFEAGGGRAMVLGTSYDSAPYHLYELLGFEGTCPEQGYGGMVRFAEGESWEAVLGGPVGAVRVADWSHWIGLQLLFGAPGPEQLRSILLPSIGPRLVEGQFIELMMRGGQAWVLEGPDNTVLGCAVLGPHPLWGKWATRPVLDLYVHPAAWASGQLLLAAALEAAAGPVQMYLDSAGSWRSDVLRAHGFEETVLGQALDFGAGALDILVMTRGA